MKNAMKKIKPVIFDLHEKLTLVITGSDDNYNGQIVTNFNLK